MHRALSPYLLLLAGILLLAACDSPAGSGSPPPQPQPQPLAISGARVAEVSDSAATIAWTTNHAATSAVECLGRTVRDDVPKASHAIRYGGFIANSPYSCEITSETQDPNIPPASRRAFVRIDVRTAAIPTVLPPAALVFTRLLVTSPGSCQGRDATPDCQADIFTLSTAGVPTNLTNTPSAHERDPAVSPDGRRVAFVSDRDLLEWDLYLMNTDGSGVERIPSSRPASNPHWSPDGTRLVYAKAYLGSPGPLCIVTVATRAQTCPVANSYNSRWSLDGTRIAYVGSGKLCVFTVATSTTSCGPEASTNGLGPAWSPDGAWIAFTGRSSAVVDNDKLYLVRPNWADLHRVTSIQDGGAETNPVWSPDAASLIFSRLEPSLAGNTYRATLATNAVQLFNPSGGISPDGRFAFTPDGTSLIISGYGRTSDPRNGLWLIRASDGARLGRVTETLG